MWERAMVDFLKQILQGQYEAALCMLNHCMAACGDEYWEGKVANGTFRQIVYHTLFFTDLYLSPSNEAFELRELHQRGGDERGPELCAGVNKEDALAYVKICRQKVKDSLAAETEQSLRGESGFSWRKGMGRAELHIYNIRHIQHHTGALAAYLRRVDPALREPKVEQLRWVGQGWR
jgi:uncharacterized damage-inducible protein DinB